jgi:hypothetical protein
MGASLFLLPFSMISAAIEGNGRNGHRAGILAMLYNGTAGAAGKPDMCLLCCMREVTKQLAGEEKRCVTLVVLASC